MTKIYINTHNDYGYAMAIIQGYIDLREYVRVRSWATWSREAKGQTKIMIHRQDKGEQHIQAFITDMKNLDCEVYTRNQRGEEWNKA